MNNRSLLKGISFGLTSGIITTLGLIIGINASTASKETIMAAIAVIALADGLSDAMGIHLSEESQGSKNSTLWTTSITTFLAKFIFAISFLLFFLVFDTPIAVSLSIIWGFSLIGLFTLYLAKKQHTNPYKTVSLHILAAIVVVVATHYIGYGIHLLIM
ncbi:MAG: hypothetical protein ACMXYF_05080 [Candidatus Woesearchaeota archaeon]